MPITISNTCYTIQPLGVFCTANWFWKLISKMKVPDELNISTLPPAFFSLSENWLACHHLCVAPGKELLIPKIAQSASWQLIGSMKSRAMRCAGGEKEDGFIRFLRVIQRIQRGHSVLLSTVLHIRLPFTLFQKQGQKVPKFHRIVRPSCMSFFKLSRTHCF